MPDDRAAFPRYCNNHITLAHSSTEPEVKRVLWWKQWDQEYDTNTCQEDLFASTDNLSDAEQYALQTTQLNPINFFRWAYHNNEAGNDALYYEGTDGDWIVDKVLLDEQDFPDEDGE